ncbi:MAG: hypothetical protein GX256_10065 [Fretibacterium sp.]|nr:hypothetical protein [Fretibacterium sp.]
MVYGATKLIYSEGKPQWLTPEGSFIPARCDEDGTVSGSVLFLRDRARAARVRLIRH